MMTGTVTIAAGHRNSWNLARIFYPVIQLVNDLREVNELPPESAALEKVLAGQVMESPAQ
jgi:hypothetical protein